MVVLLYRLPVRNLADGLVDSFQFVVSQFVVVELLEVDFHLLHAVEFSAIWLNVFFAEYRTRQIDEQW